MSALEHPGYDQIFMQSHNKLSDFETWLCLEIFPQQKLQ